MNRFFKGMGDVDADGIRQYTKWQILIIWLCITIPMGVAGWLLTPIYADLTLTSLPISRTIMMTAGLIWQFVFVLILMYIEKGSLSFKNLTKRLWLQTPINPVSKKKDKRMYFFLIPLIAISALVSMELSGLINEPVVNLLPFLAEPDSINLGLFLEGNMDSLEGAWWFFELFLVLGIFNTFLGEEMMFRGVLLPRMKGAFGKYDWVMNGILFGLYHVALPWNIAAIIVFDTFILSLTTKAFKSSWFGIIIHSGQTVFFAFIILGLVLGLA